MCATAGGAAEHRAPGRPALGPAQHHQERQRLDARRRQRGQRRAAHGARGGARRASRSTSCSISRSSSTSSMAGVLREGAIAAGLTALMILLFLGSWRSTLVVMISIPLSILTSLVVLYFLGETINTMTLGGLALAVGILVDDSTVTIENTHRLLEEGTAAAAGDAAWRGRHRHADAGLDARHLPACSPRSSSSRARRNTCSRRSAMRSCSRCSPPMACRAR